ncbi:MAG: MerR family transcriptional regulator [Candidatus Dormiibacterota bacterium]
MALADIKSLDDAATATGLGRRTLQRWLGAGLLTAYKVPTDRRRYLDLRQIERLRTTPQPIKRRRKW